MKDCIFCRIAEEQIRSEKIYENSNFFSIPDVNPKAEGHTLIISKKHFENILELPSIMGGDFLNCVKGTTLILMKKYNAEGFNLVNNNSEAAGQVVNHFHVHLIPRKKDDGIKIGI
ncbi:HIT domain protein [uncultured archaeon]|nr:HIT domain protein [uncultured archaeon]